MKDVRRRAALARLGAIAMGAFAGAAALGAPGCSSPEGSTPTASPTAAAEPTATAASPTGTRGAATDTAAPTAPASTASPIPTPSASPAPATATSTPITSDCPEEGDPTTLHCPVDVRFDPRGTPHIYAESEHDLFFTQGWLAAHERLFQIEDNRLRALGRRAELYGSGRLSDDLFMRALRLQTYGADELTRWQTAYPRELGWLSAYIAGLNAYLDDAAAGRNGARLPESYQAIGYAPAHFQAAEFMAMDRLFALSLGPDPGLELTITLLKLVLPAPMFRDLLRTAPIEPAFTTVDAETEPGSGGPRPGGDGAEEGRAGASAPTPRAPRGIGGTASIPPSLPT